MRPAPLHHPQKDDGAGRKTVVSEAPQGGERVEKGRVWYKSVFNIAALEEDKVDAPFVTANLHLPPVGQFIIQTPADQVCV